MTVAPRGDPIICRPIGTPLKATMRNSAGSGRSKARSAPASRSGCLRGEHHQDGHHAYRLADQRRGGRAGYAESGKRPDTADEQRVEHHVEHDGERHADEGVRESPAPRSTVMRKESRFIIGTATKIMRR